MLYTNFCDDEILPSIQLCYLSMLVEARTAQTFWLRLNLLKWLLLCPMTACLLWNLQKILAGKFLRYGLFIIAAAAYSLFNSSRSFIIWINLVHTFPTFDYFRKSGSCLSCGQVYPLLRSLSKLVPCALHLCALWLYDWERWLKPVTGKLKHGDAKFISCSSWIILVILGCYRVVH